ncbi:MAG: type III-A CRISPR-associated RAMP protein Csm5 [Eubacteriales bacterium]|nr:type III-A CRISPR-associated RAMP protein Csm5 [Eubacteriales bacterium]
MIQSGHLKTYDLTLETVGPVHIGTGEKAAKSNYLYDKTHQIISMLNSDKLIEAVIAHDKVDEYEQGIVQSQFDDPDGLYKFLVHTCGLKGREIQELVLYNCDAGAALDENHNLKNITQFIRREDGKAYIPGSSLKGALRTVILFHLMKEKYLLGTGDPSDEDDFEKSLVNTLHLKTNHFGNVLTKDAVNSVMRGLSVSDSEAIPNRQMTLCNKIDIHAGKQAEESKPNVCRECVKPGTEIHFALTMDQSILKHTDIRAEAFYSYLDDFMNYYHEQYESHFQLPDGGVYGSHLLFLGGGSGFFSKTLTYPYYGDEALNIVIRAMRKSKTARKHHHENDEGLGISPRTMKYTEWGGRRYPFGLCKVTIE